MMLIVLVSCWIWDFWCFNCKIMQYDVNCVGVMLYLGLCGVLIVKLCNMMLIVLVSHYVLTINERT